VPTQEKVEAVEELKTRLRGAKTVVLTEYRGLTVQQLGDLRNEFDFTQDPLPPLILDPHPSQGPASIPGT